MTDPVIPTDAAMIGILLAGVSAIIAAIALVVKLFKRNGGSQHPVAALHEAILKELVTLNNEVVLNRNTMATQNTDFLRHRIDLLNVINDVKRHLERQDEHLGRQDDLMREVEKRGRGADKAIEAILNFTRGKQNG